MKRLWMWMLARIGGNKAVRAHRAYRLATGQPVLVNTDLELSRLEHDYEEIYGLTPIFRFHRHPALGQNESLVSLSGEVEEWN